MIAKQALVDEISKATTEKATATHVKEVLFNNGFISLEPGPKGITLDLVCWELKMESGERKRSC